MIKNFLKTFSIKTAVREIEDYTQKVSIGDREQHGMILGHSYLIFAQLVKIEFCCFLNSGHGLCNKKHLCFS